jgi:hypothetical protein
LRVNFLGNLKSTSGRNTRCGARTNVRRKLASRTHRVWQKTDRAFGPARITW